MYIEFTEALLKRAYELRDNVDNSTVYLHLLKELNVFYNFNSSCIINRCEDTNCNTCA